MGYTVNLILILAVASLGFAFSALRGIHISGCCTSMLFILVLLILALSTLIGIACAVTRLIDFRKTARIARIREYLEQREKTRPEINRALRCERQCVKALDRWVWHCFAYQVGTFLLGELLLGITFLIIYRTNLSWQTS